MCANVISCRTKILIYFTILVKEGEQGPDGKIAKSVEHRLLQDTVYSPSYNREVRPALRETDVVNVGFSMTLVQIVDVVREFSPFKFTHIVLVNNAIK